MVDLSPSGRGMVQAAPIIDIAIAKSCHDKKRRGICEPVLVADVTSTGN